MNKNSMYHRDYYLDFKEIVENDLKAQKCRLKYKKWLKRAKLKIGCLGSYSIETHV